MLPITLPGREEPRCLRGDAPVPGGLTSCAQAQHPRAVQWRLAPSGRLPQASGFGGAQKYYGPETEVRGQFGAKCWTWEGE